MNLTREVGPFQISRARRARPAERLDARQLLAFEPFEKSATGGRDIGKIRRRAGLIEGGDGIAAAGDAIKRPDRGKLRRDFGDRHRAGMEWRDLESADGSVPDERPGRGELGYGLGVRARSGIGV